MACGSTGVSAGVSAGLLARSKASGSDNFFFGIGVVRF